MAGRYKQMTDVAPHAGAKPHLNSKMAKGKSLRFTYDLRMRGPQKLWAKSEKGSWKG
jgi:hypothetical protein